MGHCTARKSFSVEQEVTMQIFCHDKGVNMFKLWEKGVKLWEVLWDIPGQQNAFSIQQGTIVCRGKNGQCQDPHRHTAHLKERINPSILCTKL